MEPAVTCLRPVLAVLAISAAAPAPAADITVFAAASLKNALDEIAAGWQAQGGAPVAVSYAGSSALAKQLQQGAPADIFISASTDWMDAVQKDGLIRDDSRRDLLGNSIVLIGHGEGAPVDISPALDLAGMLAGGHLAMALVDSVPAGVYGKAALESLGLWDTVSAQVAPADNVRAALALVATGEAPLGIVYETDAAAENAVSVLGTFPADSHPPITYPVALMTNAGDGAQAFLDYLSGPEVRAAFEAQGFRVLTP